MYCVFRSVLEPRVLHLLLQLEKPLQPLSGPLLCYDWPGTHVLSRSTSTLDAGTDIIRFWPLQSVLDNFSNPTKIANDFQRF